MRTREWVFRPLVDLVEAQEIKKNKRYSLEFFAQYQLEWNSAMVNSLSRLLYAVEKLETLERERQGRGT